MYLKKKHYFQLECCDSIFSFLRRALEYIGFINDNERRMHGRRTKRDYNSALVGSSAQKLNKAGRVTLHDVVIYINNTSWSDEQMFVIFCQYEQK